MTIRGAKARCRRRVASALASIGMAVVAAGCADAPPLPENGRIQHLAGRLRDGSGAAAPVTRETRRGSGREVVAVESPGDLSVGCVIPAEGKLRFSIGGAVHPSKATVTVRSRWSEKTLWEADVPVRGDWVDATIDLSAYASRNVTLTMRADGEAGGRVLWGSPVITGPVSTEHNVLLYEIDTLRKDLLEPYGYPGRSSPVIGRLAREGVLFSECFSTATWTRPAASSILSSLSPPVHGVIWDNSTLPVGVQTLTDVLRDRGWYTVAVLTNANAGRLAGLDQGFDLVFERSALAHHAAGSDRWDSDSHISTGEASGTSELTAFLLADLLPQWEGLPLFLYLHPMDPHEPYTPRSPFSEIPGFDPKGPQRKLGDDFARYGQDVRSADHYLGRILRTFEEAGIRDRTLVAFTADHGQEFREHGAKSHGRNLFPETLDVPLILHLPDALPGAVTVRQRTSVLDIVPTVLDLLMVPEPDGMEGLSRVADARAGTAGERFPEESLFFHTVAIAMRQRDGAMDNPDVIGHVAVARGFWKCVVLEYGGFRKSGVLLFDLRDDPGEMRDVSAEHPELTATLKAEALAWWEEHRGESTFEDEVDPELQEQLRALGYVQ
ncbi:sulfatase-like hydrolase/transferase [bacterium]|nr:sulfatase-like hydrolase/transferase [bacterium]